MYVFVFGVESRTAPQPLSRESKSPVDPPRLRQVKSHDSSTAASSALATSEGPEMRLGTGHKVSTWLRILVNVVHFLFTIDWKMGQKTASAQQRWRTKNTEPSKWSSVGLVDKWEATCCCTPNYCAKLHHKNIILEWDYFSKRSNVAYLPRRSFGHVSLRFVERTFIVVNQKHCHWFVWSIHCVALNRWNQIRQKPEEP